MGRGADEILYGDIAFSGPAFKIDSAGKEVYRVILKSGPSEKTRKKITLIKEIRSRTKMGLKEAKDLVDAPPSVIASGLSRRAAAALRRALEQVGDSVVGVERHELAATDLVVCELLSSGQRQDEAALVLAQFSSLGEIQAKDLLALGSLPRVVPGRMLRRDAVALVTGLRSLGAKAQIFTPELLLCWHGSSGPLFLSAGETRVPDRNRGLASKMRWDATPHSSPQSRSR